MSKANDFAVDGKVSAIRATMSGLSSAFKDKLRLQLPIPTEDCNPTPPMKPVSPSLSEEDSPEKSRRSQSAFQVAYPKQSYSEEDSDTRAELNPDDTFKVSPRFNLSTGGNSEFVSSYVAFGAEVEPQAESFRGLRIPNQYEFTLVRSKLEEQIQDKDHLLSELKANERKLELRLSEALHSLSLSDTALTQSQHRVQSLQHEVDRLNSRSEVATLQKRISDLEHENTELRKTNESQDQECSSLRLKLSSFERQIDSLEDELVAVREESREIELNCKELKEEKLVLQENLKNRTERGYLEEIERLKCENKRLMSVLNGQKQINSAENSHRNANRQKNSRKSASPSGKRGDRSCSHEKYVSPKESFTRDMIRKDRSQHSSRHIVREVMKVLEVQQSEELLPCIESIYKQHKQFSQSQDFLQRLQAIVTACSPREAFPEPPTLSQMWKWIRRLVEEYMNLRKGPEILDKVMGVLRVRNSGDVVRTVERLAYDYEQLHIGVSQMKAKLRLPLSADISRLIHEFEARLKA